MTTNETESVDVLDYVEVLVKRRKMIVIMTVVAFLVSAVVSLTMKKKYSATARILPPQTEQNLLTAMLGSQSGGGMANIAGSLFGKGTSSDVYVGFLGSDTIKSSIVARFKLMDVYETDNQVDTYLVLDKKAGFDASKKDGIISISVEDTDPKRATEMANAYVEELSKLVARLNVSAAQQNSEFFEARLSKAKADLARAEGALKDFSQRNKALQVSDQAKLSMEGIAKLKAQLAAQQVQLAAYQNYLTDSSPEVATTKSAIASINSQIGKLENGSPGGSFIPAASALPQLGQEYLRLMREFKIQETLTELLTKQNEMLKLSEAKNFTAIQVVQKAWVPDKKVKPKRTIIVMASTMITFFASLFLAFALEFYQKMEPAHRDRVTALLRRLFSFRG